GRTEIVQEAPPTPMTGGDGLRNEFELSNRFGVRHLRRRYADDVATLRTPRSPAGEPVGHLQLAVTGGAADHSHGHGLGPLLGLHFFDRPAWRATPWLGTGGARRAVGPPCVAPKRARSRPPPIASVLAEPGLGQACRCGQRGGLTPCLAGRR